MIIKMCANYNCSCTPVHTHACTHTCTHPYAYTYMCTCTHVHMHTHAYPHKHVHAHMHMHVHIHTQIHTCTYISICAHTHACVHTWFMDASMHACMQCTQTHRQMHENVYVLWSMFTLCSQHNRPIYLSIASIYQSKTRTVDLQWIKIPIHNNI